jgi:hypothetical protein
MSESKTADAGNTVNDTGNGENQSADDSRQFTQEEFNRLLAREKYALRDKYADYDELKAKAAKLDELEQAQKSDLEKAQDALAAMQKERDEAIAERDAKQAEIDHAAAVQKAASEYKVDAALLARMSGDVDENAQFLAEQNANAQKYPNVRDNGEGNAAPLTEAEIAAEKDPAKRVRMYAALNAQQRK